MALAGANTNKVIKKPKGTSIGRGHFKTSSLNKKKKSNYKKYRGQG